MLQLQLIAAYLEMPIASLRCPSPAAAAAAAAAGTEAAEAAAAEAEEGVHTLELLQQLQQLVSSGATVCCSSDGDKAFLR